MGHIQFDCNLRCSHDKVSQDIKASRQPEDGLRLNTCQPWD